MTPAIFRKHRHEIVALFPTEPHDINGELCVCYSHVGQHSGADYWHVVLHSVPAKQDEYADLLRELQAYGDGTAYADMRVYDRTTHYMHDQRRDAARLLRNPWA